MLLFESYEASSSEVLNPKEINAKNQVNENGSENIFIQGSLIESQHETSLMDNIELINYKHLRYHK